MSDMGDVPRRSGSSNRDRSRSEGGGTPIPDAILSFLMPICAGNLVIAGISQILASVFKWNAFPVIKIVLAIAILIYAGWTLYFEAYNGGGKAFRYAFTQNGWALICLLIFVSYYGFVYDFATR